MNDGFLLGTSEGVYFYYVRNENVTRLLLQLKGETISDMLYDDKTGNCWLASLTNGVYCVDNIIITSKILLLISLRTRSGHCPEMIKEGFG